MTSNNQLTRSRRYVAAELGISELGRFKQQLIERLAIETGCFERIALEDHIEATERLIDNFKAELASEKREPAEAHAFSSQYD